MNAIESMRQRLTERFRGAGQGIKGVEIYRPTANDAPRLPQSWVPSPKVSHEKSGRPAKPNNTRQKNIWGGWL